MPCGVLPKLWLDFYFKPFGMISLVLPRSAVFSQPLYCVNYCYLTMGGLISKPWPNTISEPNICMKSLEFIAIHFSKFTQITFQISGFFKQIWCYVPGDNVQNAITLFPLQMYSFHLNSSELDRQPLPPKKIQKRISEEWSILSFPCIYFSFGWLNHLPVCFILD